MPRNRHKKNSDHLVGEDVKIAVNLMIKNFVYNSDTTECEFPSCYNNHQRAYIHELAKQYGLKSKSRGKGTNRYLTVYKRDGSSIIQNDAILTLAPAALNAFNIFLAQYPVSVKERNDLLPLVERDRVQDVNKESSSKVSKIYNIVPVVPNFQTNPAVVKHKATLPVTQYKTQIMQTMMKNQVLILTGETGSGKSTQVPQMILEHYRDSKQPARIICAQPRRISAVTVAERVAYEINETVGNTVGYQIRLESRSSGKTVLTYCTNGVLIRTLMSVESPTIGSVTHLIIDEVHERDRTTDFLLIALKELLMQYNNLRLILMSATMDSDLFSKYFNNCPTIAVPGKLFPVREYFLEEILPLIDYKNPNMAQIQTLLLQKKKQQNELEKWMEKLTVQSVGGDSAVSTTGSSYNWKEGDPADMTEFDEASGHDSSVKNQQSNAYIDECIYNAYHKNDIESALTQFLYFVYNDNVPVDYQHPTTGLTALMTGALHGMTDIVEQLLNLGANALLKCGDGRNSLDWARANNNQDVIDLIQAYLEEYPMVANDVANSESKPNSPKHQVQNNVTNPLTPTIPTVELSEQDSLLLESYVNSIDEELIDYKLILQLVKYILLNSSGQSGAILVFLPGYEDIINVQDVLYEDEIHSKLLILTLHSQMQTTKQKLVFQSAPEGFRKIILSTNIAETSITINDVVYVIDTGKHKEKTYNSINGTSSLQSMWISKACAKQRSGRAGRLQSGVCYHLMSKYRYNSLPEYKVPEMLRTPLTELCLHAKSLAKLLTPPNTTIGDFLNKAIEPPTCIVIRNAVHMLKTIDALDPWEELTELGRHLLDLPIAPKYGKMLIYACVLKCLDPILTIVASLAYREPFIIPMKASEKCTARYERKLFSANTFSDHMSLLRAFHGWQDARSKKMQHQYCQRHFISAGTMEMIVATRSQLLSQLRSAGFVKPRGVSDMKDLNTNSEWWPVIKACLVAGLYPNLVRVDRAHCVLRSQKESKVLLHPSSVLRESQTDPDLKASVTHTKAVKNLPTDWLVYEEMSRTGNLCHVKQCTTVTPLCVALFAGPLRLSMDSMTTPVLLSGGSSSSPPEDSDSDQDNEDASHDFYSSLFKLDDWILLKGDEHSVVLTFSMRIKWNSVLLKKMTWPHKQLTSADEMLIANVVQALIYEDIKHDLKQPSGIGQRPKSITMQEHGHHGSDYMSSSKTPSPTPSNTGDLSLYASTSSGGAMGGGGIKYFIIKLVHTKNIDISSTNKCWAFTTHTEPKVIQAFRQGKTVYLLFFNPSNCSIHGYARLTSITPDPNNKIKASNFVGQNLNPPLGIEWIKRTTLPLNMIKNSINTNNQDLYKIVYNDGQELQTMIGDQIKKLWDKHNNNHHGGHASTSNQQHAPFYQNNYYYKNNSGQNGGQYYFNYNDFQQFNQGGNSRFNRKY